MGERERGWERGRGEGRREREGKEGRGERRERREGLGEGTGGRENGGEGSERGGMGERGSRDRGREERERGGTGGRGCTEESEGGGGTISTFIKVHIQNAYHTTLCSTGRCVCGGAVRTSALNTWLTQLHTGKLLRCVRCDHQGWNESLLLM